MKRNILILALSMLFCTPVVNAQDVKKSELEQRAEAADQKKNVAEARFTYIRAFEDYMRAGKLDQGVDCGVKATALYYKENYYKEAFDLLRRIADSVTHASGVTEAQKAGLFYQICKERMQMYMRLKKSEGVREQLGAMENLAGQSGNEALQNDYLYNKAVYHYSFGQVQQGNAVFKQMAAKLTTTKDYDKMDEVYQTLITNARKSGSAQMVAQSYSNYLAWKDSISEVRRLDETGALKKQIADNEAVIADKDSSLTTRQAIIWGLGILAVALAAALVFGALVLMRFILLSRKQKKIIKLANESNALKAKFISNISAQMGPTLQKLDQRQPEVQALVSFADHIQTLSDLENTDEAVELEEVALQPFCEDLMNQVRGTEKSGVTLTVNAPKMSATIHREYVSHILLHLLRNAVEYTPAGGAVKLDYKKRGAHAHQFIVTDTGCGISEELREEIFKPFREIKDLTTGDGLGLPTCKQMALKMNGDLEIDPQYSKGTRFLLDLHS